MIKLSNRLEAIARIVQPLDSLVDVGTDHGYIPVWLKQSGFKGKIIATDIKFGPLKHAKITASENSLENQIDFILCNGLQEVVPHSVSCVLIAGMGGETIADILNAAPWTKDNCLVVLQPMTKSSYLREWLFENGYTVISEQLVNDGNIYEILTAKGGKDNPYSPVELLTGHISLISNDSLFLPKIQELIKKTTRAIKGLESSKEPNYEQIHDKKAILLELEILLQNIN